MGPIYPVNSGKGCSDLPRGKGATSEGMPRPSSPWALPKARRTWEARDPTSAPSTPDSLAAGLGLCVVFSLPALTLRFMQRCGYDTAFLVGDSRCGAASSRVRRRAAGAAGRLQRGPGPGPRQRLLSVLTEQPRRGRHPPSPRFSLAANSPAFAPREPAARAGDRRPAAPAGGRSSSARGRSAPRGGAPARGDQRAPTGLRSGGAVVAAVKLVLRAEGRSGSGALMFLGKLLGDPRETRVSARVTVTRAGAGAGTLPVPGILWVPRPALCFALPARPRCPRRDW